MKQLTASLAALVLGIGIGVGIGMTVSKSKLNERQKMIDDLQSQMKISKADAQKASDEAVQYRNNLSRNQALMSQLNLELERVKGELAKIKGPTPQPATTTPPTIATGTGSAPQPSTAAAVSSSAPSTDYTIKDGDSLWKIAEEQLGDGMRYKEILRLNPNITENQTLVVGTKLKIPSQKN